VKASRQPITEQQTLGKAGGSLGLEDPHPFISPSYHEKKREQKQKKQAKAKKNEGEKRFSFIFGRANAQTQEEKKKLNYAMSL
jgi:hypothetical protein